ncbi:hypothetical protein B0H03_12112 [Rathayibacter iranicus NCPPB 2253 = VKM Ac-1602]|uniref:Uncharacterized protein n=1 Tax=Rathayibacter iranicus NCPPB 2253 = VKM Ac-1602 TaxID=1328868 RepID=A0ABX5L8A5_9MICO|nr:hypothetical protein B0H03_12112 [Rathayibacter iranicus NCPPB 2253 = VKM Ac-1602]
MRAGGGPTRAAGEQRPDPSVQRSGRPTPTDSSDATGGGGSASPPLEGDRMSPPTPRELLAVHVAADPSGIVATFTLGAPRQPAEWFTYGIEVTGATALRSSTSASASPGPRRRRPSSSSRAPPKRATMPPSSSGSRTPRSASTRSAPSPDSPPSIARTSPPAYLSSYSAMGTAAHAAHLRRLFRLQRGPRPPPGRTPVDPRQRCGAAMPWTGRRARAQRRAMSPAVCAAANKSEHGLRTRGAFDYINTHRKKSPDPDRRTCAIGLPQITSGDLPGFGR